MNFQLGVLLLTEAELSLAMKPGGKKLTAQVIDHAPDANINTSEQPTKSSKLPSKSSHLSPFAKSSAKPSGKGPDGANPMKLRDVSTNAIVKTAPKRASPFETPVAQLIRKQVPKTPPRKKGKRETTRAQSVTPPPRRAKVGPLRAQPSLEDQDFPNILSPSKSIMHRKRLSLASINTTGTAASHPQPFHQPPRHSGIYEHIAAAGPAVSFIDKAKDLVTDKTLAAVKFLPTLVQHKPKKVKEEKPPTLKKGPVKSALRSSWRTITGSTNKSRSYDEIVDPTDSEDLREGNIFRTKRYSPTYGMLVAGESHQNLLDDQISDNSGDERAISNDTEARLHSDMDMSISEGESLNPKTPSTPNKGLKKAMRQDKLKQNNLHYFHDDAERAFDADIDMLTGEDDFDYDESPAAMNAYESQNRGSRDSFPAYFEEMDHEEDLTVALGRGVENSHFGVETGKGNRNNSVGAPAKFYEKTNQMELVTKKRTHEHSPNPSSSKRRSSVISLSGALGAKSSRKDNRRVSMLSSPPKDISNLSEDELCSNEYMIVPVPAKNDRKKATPKRADSRRTSLRGGSRKSLQSNADLMEIDNSSP